jgi:hypothetical protein
MRGFNTFPLRNLIPNPNLGCEIDSLFPFSASHARILLRVLSTISLIISYRGIQIKLGGDSSVFLFLSLRERASFCLVRLILLYYLKTLGAIKCTNHNMEQENDIGSKNSFLSLWIEPQDEKTYKQMNIIGSR